MTLTEYLASLKVGDVVHVVRNNTVGTIAVERVTKTQIVAGGDKFWRVSPHFDRLGTSVRGRLSQHLITPEDAAEREAERRTRAIMTRTRECLTQDITLSSIPLMRAALDEAEAALREAEK